MPPLAAVTLPVIERAQGHSAEHEVPDAGYPANRLGRRGGIGEAKRP